MSFSSASPRVLRDGLSHPGRLASSEATPPVVQTILRGLKKYGMMVVDNGADCYVGGAPGSRWDDEALHALHGVTGGDFEVVDSRRCRLARSS